jgi:hypothetical protein
MFFPLKTPRFWETYFLGTALGARAIHLHDDVAEEALLQKIKV